MLREIKNILSQADLVRALVVGIAAAIVVSYAATAAKPGLIHVVLALIGVAAAVVSFLLVAKSDGDAYGKAATVVATGLLAVLCSVGLTRVFSGSTDAPGNIPVFQAPAASDFILGGIVAAGILIYLVYALLRPERF